VLVSKSSQTTNQKYKNMKYNKSLFESIKESLNKKQTSDNSAFKDILKLEKGNSYIVRLIPNVEDFDKTIFHYYSHTWQSKADQKLVNVFCPNSYDERCPIDEYRGKIWKSKDEKAIEEVKPLKRNEQWMVNIYVVKDPTSPENQGQVKILRYGKQLHNIIMEAISGEEAEEFGEKIFDLTENGCNLKIKVDENEGGYATYVSSKFQSPSKVEGLDDPESVYETIKPLDNIFKQQSYAEIQKILDRDWFCKTTAEAVVSDEDDAEPLPVKKKAHEEPSLTELAQKDTELDDLLKDL